VSARVDGATITVAVPAAPPGITPIAHVTIGAPTAPPNLGPPTSQFQTDVVFAVDATDAQGNALQRLAYQIALSVRFTPLAGTNARLLRIETLGLAGDAEPVPALVRDNGDGTFTATAVLSHLSPFAVFTPSNGALVPQLIFPKLGVG
jgi:hypothetical protein